VCLGIKDFIYFIYSFYSEVYQIELLQFVIMTFVCPLHSVWCLSFWYDPNLSVDGFHNLLPAAV
jgi:hypothetical protein